MTMSTTRHTTTAQMDLFGNIAPVSPADARKINDLRLCLSALSKSSLKSPRLERWFRAELAELENSK